MPWLLEREYPQHRNLDPEGLPMTFEEWRQQADVRALELRALHLGRVMRIVIHPGELETWAIQAGRMVDDAARLAFARAVWSSEARRRPHIH
jgi:hypothetical protein